MYRAMRKEGNTYRRLCMIESHTACKTTLGEKSQLRDDELVQLLGD
jgi:hypothetical protein